ncbi:MAG TPA: hypothetical protein GXZ36_05785 [Firmicutes bacterium]|nr:hypothetical protein [Bacillota bacterium]
MLRVKKGDSWDYSPIRAKIRFDFCGETGRQSFLANLAFGKIKPEEVAENIRQRRVAMLKNLPWQGVALEEIQADQEIYTIPEAEQGECLAYAPVELTVRADSLEDLLPFVLREEFRKIKIIEPEEMVFSNFDMERAIYKMGQEFRSELNNEGDLF